ncbi:MAG: dipeptidase PepV [Caldisericaceae bacterium]|nr:dipeptidase PepV [Caldisericaceae bacterium]
MENFIEKNKDDLIKIVREILKIRSVEQKAAENAPFGEGVKAALQLALATGEKMGFKVKNLDNYAGYVEYGEGRELISVLGHLDVVPEGNGWEYPPYGAEIYDGKLYGRGTSDDKGPIMAALFGLYAIKEMRIPLKKRVRIIFGTNEESNWKGINYYKSIEKEPLIGFTPDGNFPVINREKGILRITLVKKFASDNADIIVRGGERANMVPDYAEAVLNQKMIKQIQNIPEGISISENKIIARGRSAHAAKPWQGENAVAILCETLSQVSMSEDAKSIIQFVSDKIARTFYGEKVGVEEDDKLSGKLTLNLGVLNIDKKHGEMLIDIRYPITGKLEGIVDNIKREAEKYSILVGKIFSLPPIFVDEKEPLVQKLISAYEEETGEKGCAMAIGGGTYARIMEKGVAFGPVFPGVKPVEHEANEYISIDNLVKLAKIYAKAIQRLAE